MTTRLAGNDTSSCRSTRGDGAAPATRRTRDGYKTAYLWEEVWQRDSLLDILARFIHLRGRRSGRSRAARRSSGGA